MSNHNTTLVIESGIKKILLTSWDIIRPHRLYMSLIWSVFYIPTNIFILIRSGDMMRNLSSGSWGVLFLMVILNLLGSIPNIAMILLIKEGDSDDYNSLVVSSFKCLPGYITTTLSMLLSMIPLMFIGIATSALLLSLLDKAGVSQLIQILLVLGIISITFFLSLIRYFSTVNFFLMKGISNFKAARLSKTLYLSNRKLILAVLGICSFLPMLMNLLTLYFVKSEIITILIGFLLGYYMFLSSGLSAGVFLHIREDDSKDLYMNEID